MPTLYLLRHADAANPAATADADRPLSATGTRQAGRLASWWRHQPQPRLVLCSPALRTRQTLQGLQLADTTEVHLDAALYHADCLQLREQIGLVDDTAGSLLLVGHNPAVHELAFLLAGPDTCHRVSAYPPATLSAFDVPTFAEVGPDTPDPAATLRALLPGGRPA